MFKINSLPLVGSVWSFIREQRIIKQHQKVSSFWRPIIEAYFNNNIPTYSIVKKKEIAHSRIIWQYWGQGVDENLPEVVSLCFQSIDKYHGDWEVIRLDDKTIAEYLEFPDFVLEKLRNGTFNKTFFSDLLRLALLKTYGGVWLDATILLTAPIPEVYTQGEYFMFQRDWKEEHKSFWKQSYAYYWNWNKAFKVNVLNSMIFANQQSVVIATLLDLMLHYWATQDKVIDYFFFQILYEELLGDRLKEYRCPIVSDVLPHIIQTKFNGSYPYKTMDWVLENNSMHKMSYFEGEALDRFKEFAAKVVS